MSRDPAQIWWTASELASGRLPCIPGSRQGVEALVKRHNWRARIPFARRRTGRGGGWEYHWKLLPEPAQRELIWRNQEPAEIQTGPDRDEVWRLWDQVTQSAKDVALERLKVVELVEGLMQGGQLRTDAVISASIHSGVSHRTIWTWLGLIDFVHRSDRLPHLLPQHQVCHRKNTRIPVDPDFGALLKSDYLRPARPTFRSAYMRACAIAEREGLPIVQEKTAKRWLDRTVSPAQRTYLRGGQEALKRMYPAQVRDKTAMHALEGVNGDFHRFDVFVRWPAGPGEAEGTVERPQMVAFQDIHSGRILSWRVDRTANSHAVRLAAGDMIERWGIPEHVLLDNGREFAAKALTGGAPSRFRFRVREDDIPGLFTALGCKIHWATPYAGQSKPIERAFRDMCDHIAKDPRFDGAYTGNAPHLKPEDYGTRAVPLEDFLRVLAEGIERHNARPNRRSEVAFGSSFTEVFDRSYATAPIRKATAEQRRFWLMGAEGLKADARTGELRFLGNVYWADWLHGHMGEKLVARFDPAALWDGLHVYTIENEYLGLAACREKVGFFDVDGARVHAKARKEFMRREKAAARAQKTLTAIELGEALDAAAPEGTEPVEAKVVRPLFEAKKTQPTGATKSDEQIRAEQEAHRTIVEELAAHRADADPDIGTPRERFQRLLEIEGRIVRGEQVSDQQRRWAIVYRETPEGYAEQLAHEEREKGAASQLGNNH